MSRQCKCGSWALNDFPDSGLCDNCYWKKLVLEAPKFFAPEHDFNGEKLKWLKRAGLVTPNVQTKPQTTVHKKMMNKPQNNPAIDCPPDHRVSPQLCPFCRAAPEQYTIGARPNFGENGQEMVRCKTGSCGLWGQPMSLLKWQERANV